MKFDEKKLEILLRASSQYKSPGKYVITKNVERYIDVQPSEDLRDKLAVPFPGDYEFQSQALEPILKMHSLLPTEGRAEFAANLVERVKVGSDKSLRLLLLTGNIDIALKTLLDVINTGDRINKVGLLNTFLDYSRHAWQNFSENQVSSVLAFISDVNSRKNKIGKAIADYPNSNRVTETFLDSIGDQFIAISGRNIIAEIESNHNPEINTDMIQLNESFQLFGFPSDLSEALEHINTKLAKANNDLEFADVMGKIRSFSERLYENIIKAIRPTTTITRKIDFKSGPEVARFFQETDFLNEDQTSFITPLKRFTENQGGAHRIKSRGEEARLSRNLTIEYSLFLMRRLETYMNDSKKVQDKK